VRVIEPLFGRMNQGVVWALRLRGVRGRGIQPVAADWENLLPGENTEPIVVLLPGRLRTYVANILNLNRTETTCAA
jgi:hypothetical protein